MSCDQKSFTSIEPWQMLQKISIKEMKDSVIFKWICFIVGEEDELTPPSVRNLPDVTTENFSRVDLHQFKWIHWEVSGAWKSWDRNPGSWSVRCLTVCSAGPKRWRSDKDDPASGGVQRLCAVRTENYRFCGDREDPRSTLPAVSTRRRGECLECVRVSVLPGVCVLFPGVCQ